MPRAMVFGKFLPFHKGHEALIRYAASRYENVLVCVFSRGGEGWPGEQRADWIRQTVPGVQVSHVPMDFCDPWDDEGWEVWIKLLKGIGHDVTHFVSSEEYGLEVAKRCGWEHDMYDQPRAKTHITGTQLRVDPIKNWEFLPDAVRKDLVKKVVLVGAESTGKSTIAKDVARTFHTECVEEFGREYCTWKDVMFLGVRDLEEIAREQVWREELAAVKSKGLIICDTDVIVTRAWCHYLLGFEPEPLLNKRNRYDIYAVTNLGVPWQQDGTRVCDKDEVRRFFHQFILREVVASKAPYIQLPARPGDAQETLINLIDTSILSARFLRD